MGRGTGQPPGRLGRMAPLAPQVLQAPLGPGLRPALGLGLGLLEEEEVVVVEVAAALVLVQQEGR